MNALADDRSDSGKPDNVLNLFFYSMIERLIRFELINIARIQALNAAVPFHEATVKDKFDSNGPLRIAGGSPLVNTTGLLRFHATHQAVIASIFQGKTFSQHHLNMSIVEVACRETHAGFNNIDNFLHVLLR